MIIRQYIALLPLLISVSSYAQTTMEGPFNSFEMSFSAGEIGVAENMTNSTRDSNMNRTVINNGGIGATASSIGNLVNVVTTGSGNTVVVNAKQVNSGNQTAIVSLSATKSTPSVTSDTSPSVTNTSTAPNNTAAVTTQGSQR